MSANTEQENPTPETTLPVSNETENHPSESASTTNEDHSTNVAPAVEQQQSSWFTSFGLPTNFTSQLTNISSSIVQVTSKVSEVANTLVQKTLPQRPSSPDENQQSDTAIKTEDKQETEEVPEENPTVAGINKDLTSIFNDLSSTVKKGAQQLRQVVEESSLLGNFSKEHEKFLAEKRTQQRREEAAVPPWVGYVEEEEMKKQILALSKEKRNFLRSPPPGANYHFDMVALYPVALSTLEVDENLKQMRFDLVPKQINEETFWCNYFYRVSLIKQSTQLSALAHENANASTNDDAHAVRNRVASDSHDKTADVNQEFVSEDDDGAAVSMDDIRREIEQLTETKGNSNKTNATKAGSPDLDENEWDKALADELENVSAEELEAQINQMLAGDTK